VGHRLVRYPPKRPDLPLEVKEGQSPLPAPRWVPRIAITEVNGLELGVVAGLVVRDSVSNVPGVAVEHRGRSRQAIPEPLNELAYRPATPSVAAPRGQSRKKPSKKA